MNWFYTILHMRLHCLIQTIQNCTLVNLNGTILQLLQLLKCNVKCMKCDLNCHRIIFLLCCNAQYLKLNILRLKQVAFKRF